MTRRGTVRLRSAAVACAVALGGLESASDAAPQSAPSAAAAPSATTREGAPRAAPPSIETTDLGGLVATARATPQVVEVGQPIEVEIVFEGDGARSVALELPDSAKDPQSPTLGDFDLVALRGATTDAAGRATLRVVLASYDAGDATPPAIAVSWTQGDARRTGEVRLPAVRIESLVGAEADPTEFRDIRGIVAEPRAIHWPLVAGIAAALLAAALVAAWLLLRRRVAVPVAPHEWARAELARIERESLAARGEHGRYYDDLTSVVRGYVSRRFEIPADRQTSREFAAAAQSHREFPSDQTARLRELLRLADLVKFAAAVPSQAECDANLAQAREFVERTKPVDGAAATAESTERTVADAARTDGVVVATARATDREEPPR